MVQLTETLFPDLQEAKFVFSEKFDFDFLLIHELNKLLPGCVGVAEKHALTK